jgi:hypothetical protein
MSRRSARTARRFVTGSYFLMDGGVTLSDEPASLRATVDYSPISFADGAHRQIRA